MSSLFNTLFGPIALKKEYCKYFQYISIADLLIVFVYFISFVGALVMRKSMTLTTKVTLLSSVLVSFLSYYKSRLLYTMCMASISGNKYNESMVNSFLL